MKQNPLVSILINNYNYGQFLTTAIDSALNQTYENIEIIVVDDGSTDNSPAIIDSYGDQIIAVLKHNGGQASAFNTGFARSQGAIICLLDADDLFLPHKIAEVVKALATYQQSGWCFHPLKIFNQPEEYHSYRPNLTLQKTADLTEYNLCSKMQRGKLGNPFPFYIPATSGMCFSRSLMKKLLPMPEAEGIILNDSYLKFAAMGISRGVALNQELAWQRIHGDNLFTSTEDQKLSAIIYIYIAYWLKINFPVIAKFANNIFALGLSLKQKSHTEKETIELIKEYFRGLKQIEKLEINFRSWYYRYRK
jgi:glycosyltransferase involved in cell wall biosynthesis